MRKDEGRGKRKVLLKDPNTVLRGRKKEKKRTRFHLSFTATQTLGRRGSGWGGPCEKFVYKR